VETIRMLSKADGVRLTPSRHKESVCSSRVMQA
jgi:hypothetical protein